MLWAWLSFGTNEIVVVEQAMRVLRVRPFGRNGPFLQKQTPHIAVFGRDERYAMIWAGPGEVALDALA